MDKGFLSILLIGFCLILAYNYEQIDKQVKLDDSEYFKSFSQVVDNSKIEITPDFGNLELLERFGSSGPTIGRARLIKSIGDKIILIDLAKPIGNIYQKDGQFLSHFGNPGRGPGEFEYVNNLDRINNNNAIWVYDGTLLRYTKFNIGLILKKVALHKTVEKTMKLQADEEYINQAAWLGDSVIVGLGLSSRKRLAWFNSSGEFQKLTGPEPPGNPGTPIFVKKQAYIGKIDTKPDETKVVLATRYTDKIEIYNDKGDPSILIIGPRNHEPTYKVTYTQDTPVMAQGGEMRFGYIAVSATDDYIYGLYSGRKRKEGKANFGKVIHVYSWNGKLKSVYELKEETIDIDVDSEKQLIYAVHYFSEDPIAVYQLPLKE